MDRADASLEGVPPACQLFQQVLERRLTQQPVSDEDIERARAHGRACEDCAVLAGALDLVMDVPELDPAELTQLTFRTLHKVRRVRRQRFTAWGGGALASLAAAAVVVFALTGQPPPTAGGARVAVARGALLDRAGAPARGGALGEAWSQEHSAGPDGALVQVGEAARLSLAAAARVSWQRDGVDGLRLMLHAGRVLLWVDPAAKIDVSVRTAHGEARVVGTVFSVSTSADGSEVEVYQGVVEVRTPSWDEPLRLRAGQWCGMRERRAFGLDQARREAARVAHGRVSDDPLPEAASPAPGSATPAPAPGPASAAVVDAGLRLDAALKSPQRQARKHRPRARPQRTEPEELPPEEISARLPAAASSETPPDQLIERANACRLRRDWSCAAATYRELRRVHPGSSEAVTVLLPLADIELDHLDAAAAALSHYRRYARERPTGDLAAEALFGAARALRRLGRAEQERQVLEELRQRFPGSPYARSAKQRLEQL